MSRVRRGAGAELTARIATVQPDDISTGDLAPDGAEVMAYRSNVPAIAEFTLRQRDPEFRNRMREWGSGFIVGGHNHGQGSSREHAGSRRCSSACAASSPSRSHASTGAT
jgi:3-isopropylmalate dehydratase small subunit